MACFPGSPHHNTALSIKLQHLCINVSIQATYGYGWSTASFLLLSFTDIRSSFTNSSFRRLVFLGPSQLHVFFFFFFFNQRLQLLRRQKNGCLANNLPDQESVQPDLRYPLAASHLIHTNRCACPRQRIQDKRRGPWKVSYKITRKRKRRHKLA